MNTKFYKNNNMRYFRSDDFNFNFNMENGHTIIWGNTIHNDPEVAPFPIICDMEITTICGGISNYGPCKFCYKSNTLNGKYMPFEKAKKIIDNLPEGITQIAFGVDAKLESNPDWYKIFKYSREKGIIPNVTVADITMETAKKIASVCGAVAVSRYDDKNICYDSVQRLTDAGMKQTNMHLMISKETFQTAIETIDDINNDERLKSLNAVVFLSLKKKGRGEKYHPLSQKEFNVIVKLCLEKNIRFGFDSCSAHKFLNYIKDDSKLKHLAVYCEPCESSIMSSYINVDGEFFPCSFVEGTNGWESGIDVSECTDFVEDVWLNPRVQNFRESLLMNKRNCSIFNI